MTFQLCDGVHQSNLTIQGIKPNDKYYFCTEEQFLSILQLFGRPNKI